MIALTQEKRKELIERYSQQIITFKYHLSQIGQEHFDGKAYAEMLLKTEIALASLTALPEYYQLRGNDNGWTGFISLDAMIMAERAGIETRSLYTIHPVPEIKLPSRIENIHLRTPLEVEDMWIDRFKRLNGLGE